ncbi:MAG: phosphatidylinositol kinase [Polaromonas sp.]|nr:phosphatidylinositol kinase [Polaromonas sp.]
MSPDSKYTLSCLLVAQTPKDLPRAGMPAVHELLPRIEVNELLGNADRHLKNLGLLYRDGRNAELAPAYDLLSTCVYLGKQGHALALLPDETRKPVPRASLLTPRSLLRFSNALEIAPKDASRAVRQAARLAAQHWLEPIRPADITPRQRRVLLDRLCRHLHFRQALTALKTRPSALPGMLRRRQRQRNIKARLQQQPC